MKNQVCVLFAMSLLVQCPGQERKPGAEAIGQLVGDLCSSKPGRKALATQRLLALGKDALPQLMDRLAREKNRSCVADRILFLLKRLGTDARGAVPRLLKRLDSVEPEYVALTLRAVGTLAPYAPELREEIKKRVEHAWLRTLSNKANEAERNETILRTMDRLVINVRTPEKELVAALRNESSFVRELAAELLSNSRTSVSKKLPPLEQALARKVKKVEKRRCDLPVGENWSFSLVAMCDNREQEELSIARAIVRLAKPREVPGKAWEHLLQQDDDFDLLRQAIQHISSTSSSEAMQRLVSLAEHPERLVALEAITALGRIGSTIAIPTLRRLTRHKDKATAASAKAALKIIEKPPESKTDNPMLDDDARTDALQGVPHRARYALPHR